jgi:propionyl-CoA carboxylase beta chain
MAVMGADGAVDIMHQRQLAGKPDAAQRRQELIDEYEQKFLNPFIAAKLGYVDEVIHPGDTKKKIKAALDMLRGKKAEKISKKHGNIPL